MPYMQIIGPPGTGKTRKLMDILAALVKQVSIDQVLFCSFTRAAVKEAVKRVQETMDVSQYELPYFGTIHRLCFRHLGLTKKNVVSRKHKKEFCDAHNMGLSDLGNGTDIDVALDEPWEPVGNEEGDVFFSWYEWARNCCLPLEEAAKAFEANETVPWSVPRALRLAAAYEDYKRQNGLMDFPQMLIEVDRSQWVPPVKVIVLDEGQDLSPLQLRLFMRWSAEKATYIGADEDQCVYNFQGADPSWLLALPGQRAFLEQSYRVPRTVGDFAQRLIAKNKRRYEKTWRPTEKPGKLLMDTDFEPLIDHIARQEESWFLLARNNIYLQFYADILLRHGIPYTNLRGASPLAKLPTSIFSAIKLATGQKIDATELRLLVKDVAATPWFRRGAKTEIEKRTKEYPQDVFRLNDLVYLGADPLLLERLSRIETCLEPVKRLEGNKAYYLKVYKRYGMAGLENRHPKVTLSSIHGVKGAEADNVVLLPNLTRRTEDAYGEDPEPERRVWYVGATRAKKRLFILEPSQKRFFEDW